MAKGSTGEGTGDPARGGVGASWTRLCFFFCGLVFFMIIFVCLFVCLFIGLFVRLLSFSLSFSFFVRLVVCFLFVRLFDCFVRRKKNG